MFGARARVMQQEQIFSLLFSLRQMAERNRSFSVLFLSVSFGIIHTRNIHSDERVVDVDIYSG